MNLLKFSKKGFGSLSTTPVIVGAKRTIVGRMNGALSKFTGIELSTHTNKAVLESLNLPPEDVNIFYF